MRDSGGLILSSCLLQKKKKQATAIPSDGFIRFHVSISKIPGKSNQRTFLPLELVSSSLSLCCRAAARYRYHLLVLAFLDQLNCTFTKLEFLYLATRSLWEVRGIDVEDIFRHCQAGSDRR
ncbi:hypothetical protein TESG_00760 [Trichophyton tonsurans CBS 112818]|uniref:Uncharacterized protein n=1 Tax=Trichophyton tonsurans (strain CBS 112818) TaxID=647933 RepID=F2RPF5_TRIT1|nr:hypothetical protein TESG_00760 [Trichophyton tonsurans CBS 112818]